MELKKIVKEQDMERFSRTALYLGGFAFLMVLSVLAVVVGILAWQTMRPGSSIEAKTLPITTEGRVFAKPDVGQVTFTVMTDGKDPKTIEDVNAKKINAIVDLLKREGVKDEDIQTSQFSLQPKYYYPYDYPRIPCPEPLTQEGGKIPCPPSSPVVIGYTLSQSVSVKIRNFEKAGGILSEAIAAGANQAGSLVFSVEDPDRYKKEARELAFRKAKNQAEELASLGGFKIDGVASIQEGYSYFPRMMTAMEDKAVVGGAPEPAITSPQIEPGSQEVVVTLTVIFKIK